MQSEKGKGSHFEFTIHSNKLHLQQQISTAMAKLPEQQATVVSPKNILIVEDNVINQKVLSRYLQQAGHSYKIAGNGKEAVELCQQYKFDVIFMDIELPVMNGLDATWKIRELEREGHLTPKCIIGLSGNIREDQKDIVLGVGMNAYLIKPYEKEKIYDVIKQWTSIPHFAESLSMSLSEMGQKKTVLSIPAHDRNFSPFWGNSPRQAPPRTWMPETLRKCLYPILDELSGKLHSLGISMVMPAARFQAKSSITGWQLFSITGKDEHWAVLNLAHEQDVDNLMAAINQSKAQLSTKKMKSDPAYAIVIAFSTQIALRSEIEKIIPSIRAFSRLTATLH